MTQAYNDVPLHAGDIDAHSGMPSPPAGEPFTGWLAMADPDGPIDLRRLFPDVEVRVEPTSTGFSSALALSEPSLVVLISPPADPGDLQRAASWLAVNPDSCAVMLSPHQAVALRLHALELGFDDAVDLSSDPMEVVGRLSIAGRRGPVSGHLPDDRILIGDGVELDRRARAIRRDGRLMSLRPKELALLEYLAMHPGRAFSRDELLRHVWHDSAGNERMVDVYVFWLRSKIERDAANPVHLVTVRGSGYLLDPP
ncbi:MAG TPA: response regulator transcription factor, partial [Candidatus Limnocylindrales bacterium]